MHMQKIGKVSMMKVATRAVTSLGHQGGEEFSKRGPSFLNYVQHIFP